MSDDRSRKQGNLQRLELRLPPLPQTLSRILTLIHEPGLASPEALAEVAQHDPAVVARLLRQINSAYYGLRRSITNVERAIRMMGPTSAAGTVIGLGMLKMDKLMEGPVGRCFSRLVRHSVGTGFFTRYLLQQLPEEEDGTGGAAREASIDDGFTAGLLHDFGKLILIYNYPEEAMALYEEKSMAHYIDETDEQALEQLVFGCDHTEAGAYAASELHFPTTLVDIIRHHHAPDGLPPDGMETPVMRAVLAANRAMKAMGPAFVGVQANGVMLDWKTCANHPVWDPWRTQTATGEPRLPQLMQALQAQRDTVVAFTKDFLHRPSAAIQMHTKL